MPEIAPGGPSHSWLSVLRRESDPERLRRAIAGGGSAALLLKRPAGLLESSQRGKSEGDELLREVIQAQRSSRDPILLAPQVFVWTRSRDEPKQNIVDSLFGPREWPGKIRTVTPFLLNWRFVTLRAAEPVDVADFLRKQDSTDDAVLVRRLMHTLLRRLERERQAVMGPTKKPADRLRDQVARSPRLRKVIRDMAGEGEQERRVLAAALLTHAGRGIAHGDLVDACEVLARFVRDEGARLSPSLMVQVGGDRCSATARSARPARCSSAGPLGVHQPGIPVGEKRGKARPRPDAVYVVPDVARLSLDISKNLMVHLFVSRAMIATALVAAGRLPRAQLEERVQALSRLFKYEFQFRADATFETIFAETLDAMQAAGEVHVEGDDIALPSGGEGRARAKLHARMVRAFVEGYRVAARGCSALLGGPLSSKDLAKRAMTPGERMFLAGEIEGREAVTGPVIENAFLAFVDEGYLAPTDGKNVLPESYATPETVRVIEARLSAYLSS